MATRLDRMMIGGLSSLQKTQTTTAKYKIRESAKSIRQGIVNFYSYEVQTVDGKMLKKDASLTTPADVLAKWISKEDNSGHPWLCMCGNVGNGKSTMLKALFKLIQGIQKVNDGKFLHHAPFSTKYLTATDLANMAMNERNEYDALTHIQLLFLDDVGTEPKEVLSFGNAMLPFEQLVSIDRYNNHTGIIFTTNLSPEELGTRYGKRFADRMRENCEFIVFDGKSFRQPSNFARMAVAFDNENDK